MSAPIPVESYGPRPNMLVPQPAAERGVAVVTSASPCGRFFLYCNGQNVIVRDTVDPSLSMVYSEHTQGVKAAKFAPTGKFIASGGECAPLDHCLFILAHT
jgi:hypothetical protein